VVIAHTGAALLPIAHCGTAGGRRSRRREVVPAGEGDSDSRRRSGFVARVQLHGNCVAGCAHMLAEGAGRQALDVAARPAMSWVVCESLSVMVREFDARLQKGDNPGAWTCVVMDDAAELFGTRGLVKIRGAIDGEPFDGALMAQGDGTHRLPVKAKLRKVIGKGAGDTVHVRIDERIG